MSEIRSRMSRMKSPSIFISAGEISGDRHAAALVREIKAIRPDISFFGMGHTALRDQGVDIIADLTTSSTVGFLEPIKHLPKILMAYIKLKYAIKKRRPDVIVVVDFQGFHMVLLKAIRALNIPMIYYIAPQEWLWGSEKGGRVVVNYTDKILCIFRQEAAFFKRLGGQAIYVGNPTLAETQATQSKRALCNHLGVDPSATLIGVFPGSRPQEIKRMTPLLLAAAQETAKKIPNAAIIVSISSHVYHHELQHITKDLSHVYSYSDSSYGLIPHLDVSLLTSGTISLEHACFGTPAVVAYQFSWVSYQLLRCLFTEKFKSIQWISLPNLIAQRSIIPEFIQAEATASALSQEAHRLIQDQGHRQRQLDGFISVKELLEPANAVVRAAQEVVETLPDLR